MRGDTPTAVELHGGALALVDAEDVDRVAQHRWYLHAHGYAVTAQGAIRMHRLILGLEVGDGRVVDHVNREKLDNRKSNLRVVTRTQNGQNTPSRRGTSRHRGVSWCKETGRWRAQVKHEGKSLNLGRFDSEDEAAEAAREARVRLLEFSYEG